MDTEIQGANAKRIKHFTDLDVWKEAHALTLETYKTTEVFPKEERYGLTNQIRRSAVSVESNIAEGFNRYHYGERINFYYDARGSLGELQSQLIIAKDLTFLTEEKFKSLWAQSVKVDVILNGLIGKTRSLREG